MAPRGGVDRTLLRSESVASSGSRAFTCPTSDSLEPAYEAETGLRDQRAAEVLGNVEAMKRAIEVGSAGKSPLRGRRPPGHPRDAAAVHYRRRNPRRHPHEPELDRRQRPQPRRRELRAPASRARGSSLLEDLCAFGDERGRPRARGLSRRSRTPSSRRSTRSPTATVVPVAPSSTQSSAGEARSPTTSRRSA